jgi:hypothetical protein
VVKLERAMLCFYRKRASKVEILVEPIDVYWQGSQYMRPSALEW